MKVAIMQPYFFPYIGYFELIKNADVFVFLDNVQFNRRGWVHRNKLFNYQNQLDWLSLPIKKMPRDSTKIMDLKFRNESRETFVQNCRKFPKLNNILNLNREIIDLMLDFDKDVNDYLCETIKFSSGILGFSYNWYKASDLKIKKSEDAQNDIINIVNFFGAEKYLNLPGGKNLYSEKAFNSNGIELTFLEDEDRKHSILEKLI